MTMKLITLGCSLTHHKGVKETLAKLLNLKLLDLAYGAGSNHLQISKLHDLLISNQIDKNDIIYWQVTAINRPYKRMPYVYLNKVTQIQNSKFAKSNCVHYVESIENIFDNNKRIDLLSNSPGLTKGFDVEQHLQELLATMILLKSFCFKLIIVFGWKNVMPDTYFVRFKNILQEYKIDYIEQPYLEYAVNNKLEMLDDMHPAESAGKQYANEIIYPALKELGWIN